MRPQLSAVMPPLATSGRVSGSPHDGLPAPASRWPLARGGATTVGARALALVTTSDAGRRPSPVREGPVYPNTCDFL
ncbi:hypothetical protein NL676_039506 [Syzygium grande]|nr:hypothetical protein NL676_039506 [Syzygium grande]